MKTRLAVLVSGNGSNLQAIIDACADGTLDAVIAVVLSNRHDAYALVRAEKAHIDSLTVPLKYYLESGRNREEYDAFLAQLLIDPYQPDWIVLAGWMHILGMSFLSRFPSRVINLHPALPGQFPGTNSIARALEAYRRGEITETGVMVHLVPDAGVDNGPTLATANVSILPDDTLDTLTSRMHEAEHHLLVNTLVKLVNGRTAPNQAGQ